jgi:pimeloyl-ACP methyl ester carboxylesterase
METEVSAHGSAVTAADGTVIRYRTFGGGGPKIVLVHGGMQTSENFRKLATALQDRYTVYLPDRRGRGLSGPLAADHGLQTEIDDLGVLLRETGARNVFGLSAGAVIALQAALVLPEIDRLALYEPPLMFDDIDPVAWLPRFEKELAADRKAAAFATVYNGTGDRKVPRAVLIPLLKVGIRADARANRPAGHTPLGELIPTMRFDGRTVQQAAGPLTRYAGVRAETLLLGGERSARYLKAALNGLERVLPRVRRVTLPGVGHLAADNGGKPELVAAQLRRFF